MSGSPKSPKKGPVWNKNYQAWMAPTVKKHEPLGPSMMITSTTEKDVAWSKANHAWTPHVLDVVGEPAATTASAARAEEEEAAAAKRAAHKAQQQAPRVASGGTMYGECTKTNDLDEWKKLDLRPRIPTTLHMENWRCAAGP